MTVNLYSKYVSQFKTKPSINQVEYNPYFQQKELRQLLSKDNVSLEAWGPLGQGNHDLLNEEIFTRLGQKYHKDNGQIILCFIIQEGVITFPKSTHVERMRSNLNIFDFSLTEEEMMEIRKLDKGHGRHNPDAPGVGEMLLSVYDVHKGE